jgi:hypothetical protein
MKDTSSLLRLFVFGMVALLAGSREAAAQDPVCLAIGLPVVSGLQGNADEHGIALRDVFTSYLTSPTTKVVALDAKLASQAPAEAKQKGCGLLLTLNATGKRNGPGMLSKVASEAGRQAAWHVPYGGTVGSAAARGAAVGGAYAIANIAAGTRAKDEMKLEYRVTSVDGKTVLKSQEEKLKASVDGEDIITPLVRKASEAIVAAVVK